MPDHYLREGQDEHTQRADRIFYKYLDTCLNYAYHKLQDKYATDEIVIPIFAALYRNPLLSRKLEDQSPLPYLIRSINNGIIDWYHQQKRDKTLRQKLAGKQPEEQAKNREEKIMERELAQQLHQLIEKLSPQRRTVMHLVLQGYSSTEIAGMLEITQQTVRNIRAQSIKLMRSDAKDRGFTPWMLLLLS